MFEGGAMEFEGAKDHINPFSYSNAKIVGNVDTLPLLQCINQI